MNNTGAGIGHMSGQSYAHPSPLRRPVHSAAHQKVPQAVSVQRGGIQRAESQDQLHPHRGVQQEQAIGQHKVHEGDHLIKD